MVFKPKNKFKKDKRPQAVFVVKKNKFKKKANKPSMVMVKQVGGFPQRYFCKLKYARTNIPLGDGANIGDSYVTSFNDPTNNNTNLPEGWQNLITAYDNYIVHACKMKATFNNVSATVPIRATIMPYNVDNNVNFGAITNTDAMVRQPYSKTRYLGVLNGSKAVATFTGKWNTSKIAGIRKITAADDEYIGNTGSANSVNPFSQPVALFNWCLGVQTSTGVAMAASSCYADTEVTYFVEFFERLNDY